MGRCADFWRRCWGQLQRTRAWLLWVLPQQDGGPAPEAKPASSYSGVQLFGLVLGPLLCAGCLWLFHPPGLGEQAIAVAACSLWIAVWWISEAVPIPVTSLLPIMLFPVSGALDSAATTAAYGNGTIFLFLGGFVIALALERWGLHRRIALALIGIVGTAMSQLVLGFMLATALLSMWISNTATAMMMVPIGSALIYQVTQELGAQDPLRNRFAKALLLGIAYAASIGGLATLIGTPPNAIFVAVVRELYGIEIGFAQWMLFASPLALIFLLLCWFYLVELRFDLSGHALPGSRALIERERQALGPMAAEERRVLGVFALAAFFWIFRGVLLVDVPGINDTSIALVAALLLFLLPARDGQRLMGWAEAGKLPWGILLLFGGGLAIAAGFAQSGLARWLGDQLSLFSTLNLMLMVALVCLLVTFLTELTSNTATATMMFPVMAALALALDIHPFTLMLAAGLASSCAFMLPVATPPNAVVFAASELRIIDMARAGFWLNLIGVLLICLLIYLWLPWAWSIEIDLFPQALIERATLKQ